MAVRDVSWKQSARKNTNPVTSNQKARIYRNPFLPYNNEAHLPCPPSNADCRFPERSQRRFWRDNHTIWRLQGAECFWNVMHSSPSFFSRQNKQKIYNYTPSTWLQSRRDTSTPESSESLRLDKALISSRPSGKSHHYEAHRSNPSCKLLESEISIIIRDGKVWRRSLCKERCYSFS